MLNREKIQYDPDAKIRHILEIHGTNHRIMMENESPQEMLDRVVETIMGVEELFGTSPEEIKQLKQTFRQHFINRDFIPGIPTLTNAGRPGYEFSALSSCVVIPVDLRREEEATQKILSYYQQNMGSGYNFTKYEDPVGMLRWLNDLSDRETKTGNYDRRIANMGTLHVSHPKIREFVQAKVEDSTLTYFNISVEITDEFMNAAANDEMYALADGTEVSAKALLAEISKAAWMCGDPGLVNLDRMNEHNPLSNIAAYDCTPPCGEMGLAPGETCQFGYINLANFVDKNGIKSEKLTELVRFVVRVLDNAVEYGIENQPSPEGQQMARLKRKIGISVAGLADALIKAGVPYDSPEGRELARDLLSLINYQAKLASVELAEERGACEAMKYSLNNKYYEGYIASRYANQATSTVSKQQWLELDEKIKRTGMLRNIHHTALPPGGRASMVLGANHSIEPIFSPAGLNADTVGLVLGLVSDSLIEGEAEQNLQEMFNSAVEAGSFRDLPISDEAKELLKTAIEIDPESHVLMTAALAGNNGVSDESASKTVNLPSSATPEDIMRTYIFAHQVGMKNVSVYRDNTLDNQPRKLS